MATSAAHRASMRGNTHRAMWGRARRVDHRWMRDYRIALGRRIRDARLELDISRDELAAGAGLHVRSVLEIELARKNPAFTTIVRLALALGLSPSELMP